MSKMGGLLIGDVARRTGVTVPTIRYYEEIGLLPAPPRSSSGYRRYFAGTLEDLRFIKKAQAVGFSLDEIREILGLSRSGRTPCEQVLSFARQHLTALDERIRQLQQFRDILAEDLAKWTEEKIAVTCRGLCQWISEVDPDLAASTPSVQMLGGPQLGGNVGRRKAKP
jgi:MerR family copper efflux transcriptional regulator